MTGGGPEEPPGSEGSVSWRALRAEATATLRAAGLASPEVNAWRIAEEASGLSGADWVLRSSEPQARFSPIIQLRAPLR